MGQPGAGGNAESAHAEGLFILPGCKQPFATLSLLVYEEPELWRHVLRAVAVEICRELRFCTHLLGAHTNVT